MPAYWITFANGPPACVEADDEVRALEIAHAETYGPPHEARLLPYPATPRLGPRSGTPSFCHKPDVCAGKTRCMALRACTD